MPEIEFETHDNTPRIALVAFAVIAALLGLLYMTSARVSEQRANPPDYAETERRGMVAKFITSVHEKRIEVRESNSQIGKTLVGFGMLCMLASNLWFAIAAIGINVGWAIAVVFTQWIGMLAFCSVHWEEAQGPAAGYGTGLAVWMIGLSLL